MEVLSEQATLQDGFPRPETPTTTQPASEAAVSTNPTTPSSTQRLEQTTSHDTTTLTPKASTRAKPIVPVVPAVPRNVLRDQAMPSPVVDVEHINESKTSSTAPSADHVSAADEPTTAQESIASSDGATVASAPTKAWTAPRSWTGLFNHSGVARAQASTVAVSEGSAIATDKSNTAGLVEALHSFNADAKDGKVAFLEPRGLVNTGNMCYMNSVSLPRHVLVSCANKTGSTSTYFLCTLLLLLGPGEQTGGA